MDKKAHVIACIGGPESTVGTAVARIARLPITGIPTVKATPTKQSDEAITGRNTKGPLYTDAIEVTGELSLKFAPCAGIGMGFASLLGADAEPKQVGGAILLRYTGAQASCKIVVSDTGQQISSFIGSLGSEQADAAFGTAGVESLTDESVNTLAELIAVINGYADYEAEKLFGADNLSTTSPVAITAAQAKDRQVVIFFVDDTSGIYLHRLSNVVSNTERPTYSLQVDGIADNILQTGVVVDSASISAELKGRAVVSMSLMGLTHTGGQAAADLPLPAVQPMRFFRGSSFVSGEKYSYIKSFSLDIKNNHDSDTGYGQGSLYKKEHARGEFDGTGSFKVRTDAAAKSERQKVLTDGFASLLAVFQGGDYSADIPELAIIDIPAVQYTEGEPTESGNVIDLQFSYQVIDPMSYDPMIQIMLLTPDAGRYDA